MRWLVQVNLLLHSNSSITTLHACQCVQPGLEYFQDIFETADNLSQPLSCFKAAHLIDPTRVNDLQLTAADVWILANYPFINDYDLDRLILELPAYLAASLKWGLCHWHPWLVEKTHGSITQMVRGSSEDIFCQPSSAGSEQVFSLLKASFSDQKE